MGPTLYLFRHCKFEHKLDCLYPTNVHGIVAGADNKLAVFGAKSICICKIVEIADDVRYTYHTQKYYNKNLIM